MDRDAAAGNDPSWLSGPILEMSERWQPMLVCMNGTQGFRENAGTLLANRAKRKMRQPGVEACEPRSAVSPFTMRIADQAAGLIMRKPVQLEPKGRRR